MKTMMFAGRTAKEILRDPLNLVFGLGFPVTLLLLLSAIEAHIPVALFDLAELTPGVAVFGLSFMTLFAATLLAKDRESALLQRLYTTPMSAANFIFGYAAPMFPIALAQSAVCFVTAAALGLRLTRYVFAALAATIPMAVFLIALGLICGSMMNAKQVGGVCGALLTNLSAWLSGVWFDVSLVGGPFETVARSLPFLHAVEAVRAALQGNWVEMAAHMPWTVGYAMITAALAVICFLRQMKAR